MQTNFILAGLLFLGICGCSLKEEDDFHPSDNPEGRVESALVSSHSFDEDSLRTARYKYKNGRINTINVAFKKFDSSLFRFRFEYQENKLHHISKVSPDGSLRYRYEIQYQNDGKRFRTIRFYGPENNLRREESFHYYSSDSIRVTYTGDSITNYYSYVVMKGNNVKAIKAFKSSDNSLYYYLNYFKRIKDRGSKSTGYGIASKNRRHEGTVSFVYNYWDDIYAYRFSNKVSKDHDFLYYHPSFPEKFAFTRIYQTFLKGEYTYYQGIEKNIKFKYKYSNE